MTEKSTSLSGLLAHYDSDSEHEDTAPETKKLDAKVDDFLQEINQLASTDAPEAIIKSETNKMPTCGNLKLQYILYIYVLYIYVYLYSMARMF